MIPAGVKRAEYLADTSPIVWLLISFSYVSCEGIRCSRKNRVFSTASVLQFFIGLRALLLEFIRYGKDLNLIKIPSAYAYTFQVT